MDKLKICYNLLLRIYRDGAYSGQELNEALNNINEANEKDKAYITRLFYGVLDKSVRFDFMLNKLCDKKPQNAVALLLKIGLYLLEFMRMPDYAAVNETVVLAKSIGKGGAAGFINAVLRARNKVIFPKEESAEYLSVEYSYPMWLIQMLLKDYGYAFTEAFLKSPREERTHIRRRSFKISLQEFEQKYPNMEVDMLKLGYYVTHTTQKGMNLSDYTIQSLSSMMAVHAYLQNLDGYIETQQGEVFRVLDTCAAPGGKSIYLKELLPTATIVACDKHEHRIKLIEKYAQSCAAQIQTRLQDATDLAPEWKNGFDLVVCDVPCSGIGVIDSKPDIMLNRKAEDIATLTELQRKIIEVSSHYVKKGGCLCYSTCTVIKAENEQNIMWFLNQNNSFVVDKIEFPNIKTEDGMLRLFPNITNTDGFFVARLKRIK